LVLLARAHLIVRPETLLRWHRQGVGCAYLIHDHILASTWPEWQKMQVDEVFVPYRVPDGRPEHLRAALEGSLRRLRRDRIDLYQFHRPDPAVPFEESVGALARMQEEGKIRHVGLSNVTLDEVARARRIVPIVSVQNHYNLASRQSERMSAADS